MMRFQSSKSIAYCGLLTTLAMVFSYVESLIPLDFSIPGVKLGLANVVSVIAIYLFAPVYAYIIVILRVLLTGFLFGNLYSIIYSLSGAIFSLLAMIFLKKTDKVSIYGVSITGGVVHNIGQLFVAVLVVNQLKLSFYGPVLIISGVIMGFVIGWISSVIIKRVETYVR